MSGFSDILVSLRKREELSQQELADELGVARSCIGMYETAKREPDLNSLKAIADFFDVSTDYLLGREQPNKDYESDELVILSRNVKKLSPEERKQLLEMAKIMFKEEFKS